MTFDRPVATAATSSAVATILVAMVSVTLPAPCFAHSMQVAVARVSVETDDTVRIQLKSPEIRGRVPLLTIVVDEDCTAERIGATRRVEDAVVDEWTVRCADLDPASFGVEGLGRAVSEAVILYDDITGAAASRVIAVGDRAPLVPTAEHAAVSESSHRIGFIALGFEHILIGWDHLLFVLGLVLVIWRRRALGDTRWFGRMLDAVTAFTLAHSITLALSALAVFQLPVGMVEVMIALSIVLLAWELARFGDSADTLTFRHPWLVAFAFGLLHGLGFAAALAATGLPERSPVPALLGFNVGVELGQLAFVAVAVVLLLIGERLVDQERSGRTARLVVAYVLGGVAMWATFGRLAERWLG